MPLPEDWRAFIGSLNSNGVEYLVVGAVALAYHGLPRYTGDLDVLVRNSRENGERVEAAVESFGLGGLGLKADDFVGPYQVVQVGGLPTESTSSPRSRGFLSTTLGRRESWLNWAESG